MSEKIGGILFSLFLIIASVVLMVVFRTNENYITIFIVSAIVIVFGVGLMIKTIKE